MCARYAFQAITTLPQLGCLNDEEPQMGKLLHILYCITFRKTSPSQQIASLNSESAWLRMRMDWYYPKFEEVMQRASRRILTYRASMPVDEIVLNLEYFQHYYFITNHNHITKNLFSEDAPNVSQVFLLTTWPSLDTFQELSGYNGITKRERDIYIYI